jgi:hypothetical protein
LGGGLLGFYVMTVSGTKGNGATNSSTGEASTPMPTETGECGVGVVQGRGSSRPRQSTSRRAGEAGAAGGGVCVPVRELSVWGRVRWRGAARAPAQQRGEVRWCWREAGVV